MPEKLIMVRESEWREMREALRGCQGVLADLNRPRGAPESIPNLYARSVEAEAKARAALAKAEATATQPVAHAYVVDGECEQIEWGGVADYPDDPALVWLYTHPTPDGCGREGRHQWGGPERNREVCVNCGATRVLEGGDDG